MEEKEVAENIIEKTDTTTVSQGFVKRSVQSIRNFPLKFFFRHFSNVVRYSLFTFFVVSISGVIIFRFIPPTITPLMAIRMNEQLRKGEKVKMNYQWVPLEKISPNMQLAVVASEDNRFTEHFGIDLKAIRKARREATQGRRLRGASTISQQTAKNVFLWPGRSWIRKGVEVYFTILIELFWGKRHIMEVYLNVIEMGNGIYGAEAAALTYFHKHALFLTRGESALIAATLPNPLRWRPNRPTRYLLGRQQWILWNMNNIGKIEY